MSENEPVKPKQKFYEAINSELSECVDKLVGEHPELEGAAIAVIYSPEFGDVPCNTIIGAINNPEFLCRAGLRVAQLQTTVAHGIAQHIHAANEFHARQATDDKIEKRRQE